MSRRNAQQNDGGREFPVAFIQKNGVEDIGVRLSEYRGHRLIDIRVYAFINGEFRPTKKGFALRVAAIQELAATIELALDYAQNLGWLDDVKVPSPEQVAAAEEAISRARAGDGLSKRRGEK